MSWTYRSQPTYRRHMTSRKIPSGTSWRPFHPPLVHVPIGGVIGAATCDIVSAAAGSSRPWARTWFHGGSVALMIGTVVMLLAVAAGLADRARRVPRTSPDRPRVNRHATVMSVLAVTCVLDLTLRNNRYPHASHTPLPVLVFTLVASALTVAGGELGGRVVYCGHGTATSGSGDALHGDAHGGYDRAASPTR